MGLLEKYAPKADYIAMQGRIKKFQEGGMMAPPPEAAPAPGPGQGGGGDIMAMLDAYRQQPSPQLAEQIVGTLLAMQDQDNAAAQAVPAARIGGTIQRKTPVFNK